MSSDSFSVSPDFASMKRTRNPGLQKNWRGDWCKKIICGFMQFLILGGLVMVAEWGMPVAPAQAGSLPVLIPSYLMQAAPSVEELRKQQQQLEQQRSRLNQQQQQLENLQEAAEDRLEGIQTNIQTTAEKIRYNEQQLAIATKKLKELQSELAKAEASYQARQFSTVARLRYLQRQQSGRGWAVLLQSSSINEFLDRRYQLKRVYEADRHILADLKTEADELERQKRNIERQKNDIALLTQELQAQKAQYQAQAETQVTLVTRLKADRNALEAAESQLEEDSANLTQLIRQRIAAANRNSVVVQGTGELSYPSSGRITSNFGYRIHPILGYRRFHAGVDFGASQGSPIRAADSGTVIFSGWYGGYGRAVIIDHGNDLTTLYGHASELYVNEGQAVERGQAIAAVGATGLATGPHLHFEVRVNGDPVNPMGYL